MLSFLHSILFYVLAINQIIAILLLAITLHELGHLFASKRCGCRVYEFSIGFGRKIFSKTINGTLYKLSWILLGGYCCLEGELNYSKSKTALTNLKYRQKVYIVLAGIGANCLSAIFSFGLFTMFKLDFFYYFAYLSILLGLSNLIILVPGIDGSYPLLFLLEKVFGKKEGIKVMQRAVDVGMFFINILNIGCIVYFVIYFLLKLIKG
jgi:membrane-associated protease RseP (regulator of RpoE activity)